MSTNDIEELYYKKIIDYYISGDKFRFTTHNKWNVWSLAIVTKAINSLTKSMETSEIITINLDILYSVYNNLYIN